MKKAFLLFAACILAFSTFSQNSEVEVVNQLTKAEQFKRDNSFIKEAEIYSDVAGTMKASVKLFTNLLNNEQLVAIEFCQSVLKLEGMPLGYLDLEQVDDLLLALETILEETKKTDKKEKIEITYTAPGGIDVFYTHKFPGQSGPVVVFRKKWYMANEYGVQTATYSSNVAVVAINWLPKLIEGVKEAKIIAAQALGK